MWRSVFREKRTKVRKKTKYTILDNMDEQERMELQPKYNIKHRSTEHNSSLMMSESELDSEQDNIYNYGRVQKAHNRIRNGDTLSLCPVESWVAWTKGHFFIVDTCSTGVLLNLPLIQRQTELNGWLNLPTTECSWYCKNNNKTGLQ